MLRGVHTRYVPLVIVIAALLGNPLLASGEDAAAEDAPARSGSPDETGVQADAMGRLDLPCVTPITHVEQVGDACATEAGLLRLYDSNGRFAGTTHGGDPVLDPHETDPAGSGGPGHGHPAVSPHPPRDPHCIADPATEEHIRLIYARPHDRSDRYASKEPEIRDMLAQANGHLHGEAEAIVPGMAMDLRLICSNGVPVVDEAVLPTDAASSHFVSIVEDLEDLGYDDPRVKYWVWYDYRETGWFGGQAHLWRDDRPTMDNANNGDAPNGRPSFGLNYQTGWFTMLHEGGHTLGAVQNSAPNTSGYGHCNDGLDIMCYDDGGPYSDYDPGVCTHHYLFDCNRDDYFHPAPPDGSHLADHWNLAWGGNRYLELAYPTDVPVVDSLTCDPSANIPTKQNITCTFEGTTSASGIAYFVAWGEDGYERVPESGHVAPGVSLNATQAYSKRNDHVVAVTPIDSDGRWGRPELLTLVVDQNSAPLITSWACTPEIADPWPHDRLRCEWQTDDDSAAVRYTIEWGDGWTTTTDPYDPDWTLAWIRGMSPGTYTAQIRGEDDDDPPLTGPWKSTTIRVNGPPEVTDFSCAPPEGRYTEAVACSFVLVDDFFDLHAEIDWGDGTTTRVPATGEAAPGSSFTVDHTYGSGDSYPITVVATDTANIPLDSDAIVSEVTRWGPCALLRDGSLTAGLGGVLIPGISMVNEPVPEKCRHAPFSLSGSIGSDFNVCWLDDANQVIRCDQKVGDESGTIPDDAVEARIMLRVGAAAQYRLRAGDEV